MAKKPSPKNLPNKNNPINYLILVALIGAGMALFIQGEEGLKSLVATPPEEITISQFIDKFEEEAFTSVTIKDQKVTAEGKNGITYLALKEINANITDLGLSDPPDGTTIEIADTTSGKLWTNLIIGLLPFMILILLIWYFMRRAGNMGGESGPFGFGKSKAKVYDKTKNSTKFSDVAGAEEAKEDVLEVVDFLKNPKKYEKAGAKIPKGILMVGQPGTGKTLMARAIAGEANVPFFSVSGSEFVEMFVGVGASRVRDLFKTAKRNAPAIIFIDEIDAIGKQRGVSNGSGGHDEREQTLNQILTEMDGFEAGESVIVVAATNRPDVLDKALLRPGRFDRRVHIDLPDMEAREKILKVHTKNKVLAKGVKLKEIASKTVGFSGADLENVMNEAAIASVKDRQKTITQLNLNDAVEKVSLGAARKSRRINDKEKDIIAIHEVGHAIAGHFTKNCEPVHKISIISRGSALGVTWFLPVEDTYLNSEAKMRDEMVSLHGGRIAERMTYGQTTTGASNDLERISRIARGMVMTYGMGDQETIGPVVFEQTSRGMAGEMSGAKNDHSQAMAEKIDAEVKRLVQEAEERCTKILKEHKTLLRKIADDLLEKENILEDEFLAYFKKK